MKQKGLSPIIIVVLIVVLTIAGYFLYKNNSLRQNSTASLVPADSQTPAAGSCNPVQGGTVSVTLNIDVPNPRCVIISGTQKLTLINGSGQTVSLNYGSYVSQIPPGNSYTFPLAAGLFLSPGVHRIQTSLYSGSGPEVWLQ